MFLKITKFTWTLIIGLATIVGVLIAIFGLPTLITWASLLLKTLNTPMPVWTTMALVLVIVAYVYISLKVKKAPVSFEAVKEYESLIDQFDYEFGVLWDKKDRPRCNSCMTLLQPGSAVYPPAIFYCSNTKCKNKYVLKDEDSKDLTLKDAIDRRRKGRDLET